MYDPSESSVSCSDPMDYNQHPWNSPDKNSGVGNHSLLQGIFQTQGSNLGLLHYRKILYHLSHQGSPERPRLEVKPAPSPRPGKTWSQRPLSASAVMTPTMEPPMTRQACQLQLDLLGLGISLLSDDEAWDHSMPTFVQPKRGSG